jgi:hypothetical protein
MKIKLAGVYADFTGAFGVLTFVDGLSTDDVSALDGRRMGTLVPCTTEDGQDPMSHMVDWNDVGIPMSVPPEFTRLTTVADQQRAIAKANPEAPKVEAPVAWNREKLEALADARGIAGIRVLSDPLGLKGTSIKGLIDQILSGKVAVDDTQGNQDVTTKV